MSIDALHWARRQDVVDPATGNTSSGAKFVLMMLADRADERWTCWPSVELLATETHIAPQSVRRHLRLLERLGMVVTHRQRDDRGRLGGYRFVINPALKSSAGSTTAQPDHRGEMSGGHSPGAATRSADDVHRSNSPPGQIHHLDKKRSPTAQFERSYKEEPSKEPSVVEDLTLTGEIQSGAGRARAFFHAYKRLAVMCGLPNPAKLTAQRRAKIAARLREHGPDAESRVIAAIRASPHVQGQNRDGWRLSIDTLIRPEMFNRVIEGEWVRDRAQPTNRDRRDDRSRAYQSILDEHFGPVDGGVPDPDGAAEPGVSSAPGDGGRVGR